MTNGTWMTIQEYSNYREVSISTIRRYIKNKQIVFKKEDGKYLIHVSEIAQKVKNESIERKSLESKLEIEELKREINKLREENDDLKSLINILEANNTIPELELERI